MERYIGLDALASSCTLGVVGLDMSIGVGAWTVMARSGSLQLGLSHRRALGLGVGWGF